MNERFDYVNMRFNLVKRIFISERHVLTDFCI